MADQSKNKWFPWRRLLRSTQTPRPETREVAVSQVTDKYSEYPSDGLTPVRLAEIFKEADAGDVLRQAELFEEMEEKDPHLFSQLQTRKTQSRASTTRSSRSTRTTRETRRSPSS